MPFEKGREKTGGRKAGVPNQATSKVRELASQYCPEAIEILINLARNADTDATKVSAVRELLDRGFGKPKAYLEFEETTEPEIKYDLNILTLEELYIYRELLAKITGIELEPSLIECNARIVSVDSSVGSSGN